MESVDLEDAAQRGDSRSGQHGHSLRYAANDAILQP
jgi:hypothetical protein